MSMICAISSEVPENPVVSVVSGAVFEKRLILQHVKKCGTDPTNGEVLSEEQLVEIKGVKSVKAKAPTATSIPSLLKTFQDEWDSLMHHNCNLRQQLQIAKEELSHALYQHDAACRVIARLNKELIAAREALSQLKPSSSASISSGTIHNEMNLTKETNESDETTQMMDEEMKEINIDPNKCVFTDEERLKLQELSDTLSKGRKGRKRSENYATPKQISSYEVIHSESAIHQSAIPGILTMDTWKANPSFVATGGADRDCLIYNYDKKEIVAKLEGHTKKVSTIGYHPTKNFVISGSNDQTMKVWDVEKGICAHTSNFHKAPIISLSVHSIGDYVLAADNQNNWSFSDFNTGRLFAKQHDDECSHFNDKITCAKLHPDGVIFALGTESSDIRLWELKTGRMVTSFQNKLEAVTALAFSENGYYVASALKNGVVKLWDLRKLANFATINIENDFQINDICFDNYGSYLGINGTRLLVYGSLQRPIQVADFNIHTANGTAVRFGPDAQTLISTSLDRSLKVLGMKSEDN